MPHRLSRASAERLIEEFFQAEVGEVPDVCMEHDQSGGWKFWIEDSCYTSYVHSDGGEITYADLSRTYGSEIRAKRYLLHAAIRLLNSENGALFVSIRNVGFQRLRPANAHEVGPRIRRSVRRKANRGSTMIGNAVAFANDMPDEAKRQAMSEMASLGLLRMMATDKHRVDIPDVQVRLPQVNEVARSALEGLRKSNA